MAEPWSVEGEARLLAQNYYSWVQDKDGLEEAIEHVAAGIRAGLAHAQAICDGRAAANRRESIEGMLRQEEAEACAKAIEEASR